MLGLKVNSGAFNAGLNKASGTLKSFVGGLGTAKGALLGLGAAIGAGAALKGILDQVNAIDQLADTATKLSITTEALGKLNYTAQLAGSSAESMQAALQKMQLNLGKANGDKDNAFSKIGLDLAKLKKLTPDAQFTEIAGALNKIKNPADQAAAAVAIFGKGAGDLMQIFQNGKGFIADTAAEAEKLGFTVSQVDAEAMGGFNDSLDKAKLLWEAMKNQLAINIAPILASMTEDIISWAKSGEGFGSKIEATFDTIKAGWFLVQALLVKGLGQVVHLVYDLASGAESVINALGGDVDITSTLKAVVDSLDKSADESMEKAKNHWDGTAKKERDAAKAKATEEKKAQENMFKPFEGIKGIFDNAKGMLGGQGNTATALGKGIWDAVKGAGSLANDLGMFKSNPFEKKDQRDLQGDFETKLGAAAEFGSADAMLAELTNRSGGGWQEKLQKTNDEQLKVAKDSDRNLEKLASTFTRITGFKIN